MKRAIKYLSLLIVPILAISNAGCARTVTSPNANKVVQLTMRVKGTMLLSNSNVTYYAIFYAPKVANTNLPIDNTIGPRVNSASLTRGREFLEGRLPFIDQLVGDQPSQWTDFFYITSVSGRTVVGRGRKDNNGNPIIYDRNYVNQNTKPIANSSGVINGYQIEFFLDSLNSATTTGQLQSSITANLASSENIDTGIGTVFDSWRQNIPFTISLSDGFIDNQQDITPTIVLRRTTTIPNPVLPPGVNPDDVNITEYSVRVTQ